MAKGNKTHLSQGEGGGGKTRRTCSHTDQATHGGAGKRGPSGDHLEQMSTGTRESGSHLDQQPSMARGPRSSQRGGGTRHGNDHTKGMGKSGSKNSQNPNFG
jgi:hypothetical protein